MIVIDASTIVSAALAPDSLPWQALMKACAEDVIASSEDGSHGSYLVKRSDRRKCKLHY